MAKAGELGVPVSRNQHQVLEEWSSLSHVCAGCVTLRDRLTYPAKALGTQGVKCLVLPVLWQSEPARLHLCPSGTHSLVGTAVTVCDE